MAAPSTTPLTKLQLHLTCKNLMDLDKFSKSDPQVYVFLQDDVAGNWGEVGRTEMIKDNLNPVFTTPINVNYEFERLQKLRFAVVIRLSSLISKCTYLLQG